MDGQTVPVNQVTSLVKITAGYLINDGSVDGTFVDRQYTTTNLTGFTGGTAATNSAALVDTTAVSTDFYPATYRNERNGASFQYTLSNCPQVVNTPALTVGTYYTLKLHFAEITPGITQAGQRQFNVAVNGTQYLTNFDIVAEAGGAQKAVVKTYTVTPNASGQIVILFTAGAAGLPKVSALELFSVAPVTSGTTSASANVVYQIASGATAAQGSYSADRFYNGGGPAPSSRTINTGGVNNPAPASVYQNNRSGAVTYTLPSLAAGQIYTVRLHFAETSTVLPGQRQFNVLINGARVLTNFDIAAAAGGQNIAVVQAFPAAASASGQIVIAFKNGATSNVPRVSGVELVTGFRVSAGGPGASYWEADQSYNLGGTSFYPFGGSVSTTGATDPAPAIVYLYQRYGGASYLFRNLTPGVSYGVRLHFAELYSQPVGVREMNAVINGVQVLTNYDIYANAGGLALANVQEFASTASSTGQIAVSFSVGATPASGPCISGIELVGGSTGVVGAGQYTISGFVVLGGSGASAGKGVAGAAVTLSGSQAGVAISGPDGSYSFVVGAGSYVVGAAFAHYTMSGPITVGNVSGSVTGKNFTASLTTGGSLAPTLPNKEYIFMNGAIVAVEHAH